ncbi:MAG: hypothetical protein ABL918_01945 [Chakrabartia sp.]
MPADAPIKSSPKTQKAALDRLILCQREMLVAVAANDLNRVEIALSHVRTAVAALIPNIGGKKSLGTIKKIIRAQTQAETAHAQLSQILRQRRQARERFRGSWLSDRQ